MWHDGQPSSHTGKLLPLQILKCVVLTTKRPSTDVIDLDDSYLAEDVGQKNVLLSDIAPLGAK